MIDMFWNDWVELFSNPGALFARNRKKVASLSIFANVIIAHVVFAVFFLLINNSFPTLFVNNFVRDYLYDYFTFDFSSAGYVSYGVKMLIQILKVMIGLVFIGYFVTKSKPEENRDEVAYLFSFFALPDLLMLLVVAISFSFGIIGWAVAIVAIAIAFQAKMKAIRYFIPKNNRLKS